MAGKIDLHCHTTASDGELSAEEIVNLAVKKGLKAIAITDHDSLASIGKAVECSKGKKIEVVPGIELSCNDQLFNYDKIDVLGLLVDYSSKSLIGMARQINEKRDTNKKQIIMKLNKLGFEIDFDEVKKTAKGTFGRPHIAKFLMKKYPGRFASVRDVFDRYIGAGKAAFVKPENFIPVKDAVRIISRSGGVSILAHPGIYPRENSVKLISYFIGNGGNGIETYYPYHMICPELNLDEKGNSKLIGFYKGIAKSKKLIESGGSDYHGAYRPTLGKVNIPYRILESLRKRIPAS